MNKKIIILGVLAILIFGVGLGFLLFKDPTLKLKVTPKDAEISINNKKAQSKNNTFKLDPGTYGILVEKKGFTSEDQTVELKRGENKTIEIALAPYVNSFLPEENDHFKIEETTEGDNKYLQITLYAIFNRPEQLESYKAQLRNYQKEALAWLKEKGVNTKKADIKWIPEEKYFKQ